MSNEVDLRKQRKVSAEVTIDTAGLATEATLQAVLGAVDGLELSVGNIEIDADQINLNTDDLESLVTDTNTKLDTLNSNVSTEFQQTLQTSLLGDINQSTDEIETKLDNIILVDNSILSELQDINKHVDSESKGIVAASTVSVLVTASNVTRKSLRIRNLNNKKMCLSFVTPATLNDSIFLNKDEIWIEEENFGNIYGIWDAGATGNGCAYEEVFE